MQHILKLTGKNKSNSCDLIQYVGHIQESLFKMLSVTPDVHEVLTILQNSVPQSKGKEA